MENKNFSWIRYIKQRIEKNKNFLCTITGPTGSGKSWTAMSIAEMLNEDFSVERIIFKGKDLLKQINSKEFDNKKGVVFIWDEAGVDLSNRDWQSLANKMLNFLLQTFRHRCFILFFTVPYADFLDVATRKLFHADFETVSINRRKKTVKIKPKLLQYNSNLKKWYRKYLRVIRRGIGITKIKRWSVPKPSDEIIEEYEKKKNLFTSQLNKEIEIVLEKIEKKDKTDKKPLTELQKKIVKCWEKKIFNQREIGKIVNRPQPRISNNERYMRRKGYSKEDYGYTKDY